MKLHSTLAEFRLSIDQFGSLWFGCLYDSEESLVAASFGPRLKIVRDHLTKFSETTVGKRPNLSEHILSRQMINLFNGDSKSQEVVLNSDYVTGFRHRVCRVLSQIPRAKVTTYGRISRHLGSSPRAVGGAVGSNPWTLFVPCHRVVNGNLSIGNYSMCGSLGEKGTSTKRYILEKEDVPIQGDRVERIGLWDPSEKGD